TKTGVPSLSWWDTTAPRGGSGRTVARPGWVATRSTAVDRHDKTAASVAATTALVAIARSTIRRPRRRLARPRRLAMPSGSGCAPAPSARRRCSKSIMGGLLGRVVNDGEPFEELAPSARQRRGRRPDAGSHRLRDFRLAQAKDVTQGDRLAHARGKLLDGSPEVEGGFRERRMCCRGGARADLPLLC